MKRSLVLVLAFACSSKSPTPTTQPAPPPDPGSGSATGSGTGTGSGATTQCTGAPPAPDYVCVQDCGPPVARPDDPPPGYRWLSPADAENRKKFGCPKCLPPDTLIATPDGDRAISELAPGAAIYTVDAAGQRVVARVVHAASAPVGRGHQMARVTLADGRTVAGSLGHPDAAGRGLGALHAGDALDRSRVARVTVEPFAGERTWDVLPSGPTGLYIANGVVLRSTFFGR